VDKKDILLLTVNASQTKSLTPVQLQKSLFLISQAKLPELPEDIYLFEPYHYGPFCVDIYSDAEQLQKLGLLIRVPSPIGSWTNSVVTASGAQKASELEKAISAENLKFIQAIVSWVQSLSFSQLVKTIYQIYPQFRQNSVFQG